MSGMYDGRRDAICSTVMLLCILGMIHTPGLVYNVNLGDEAEMQAHFDQVFNAVGVPANTKPEKHLRGTSAYPSGFT